MHYLTMCPLTILKSMYSPLPGQWWRRPAPCAVSPWRALMTRGYSQRLQTLTRSMKKSARHSSALQALRVRLPLKDLAHEEEGWQMTCPTYHSLFPCIHHCGRYCQVQGFHREGWEGEGLDGSDFLQPAAAASP